jgi:hypothetical protein
LRLVLLAWYFRQLSLHPDRLWRGYDAMVSLFIFFEWGMLDLDLYCTGTMYCSDSCGP